VYLPVLSGFLETGRPGLGAWALTLGLSLLPLVLGQVILLSRRGKRDASK